MFIKMHNKKAVSVMIGYILLITFAVVIAGVVYQWLKSYVPQEGIECPDGVSLYINNYENDVDTHQLTLNIRNNGKFNFGGIFIRYSNESTQEIAPFELSQFVISGGLNMNPGIKFSGSEENSFKINGEDIPLKFSVADIPYIYSIEITPIRWQEKKNKKIKVSCTNSGTRIILDLDTSKPVKQSAPVQASFTSTSTNSQKSTDTSTPTGGGTSQPASSSLSSTTGTSSSSSSSSSGSTLKG